MDFSRGYLYLKNSVIKKIKINRYKIIQERGWFPPPPRPSAGIKRPYEVGLITNLNWFSPTLFSSVLSPEIAAMSNYFYVNLHGEKYKMLILFSLFNPTSYGLLIPAVGRGGVETTPPPELFLNG